MQNRVYFFHIYSKSIIIIMYFNPAFFEKLLFVCILGDRRMRCEESLRLYCDYYRGNTIFGKLVKRGLEARRKSEI